MGSTDKFFKSRIGGSISPPFGLVVAAFGLTATLLPTSASAGGWGTIANSNTTIPGTTKTFSSFNQPSINNRCLVAFRARSTGPGSPERGVYYVNQCLKTPIIRTLFARGSAVPSPNNSAATFNEFPSFPRIDLHRNVIASRAQHEPVWTYTTSSGETKAGTAGVYLGRASDFRPTTGATQLGAVPGFEHYSVPDFPGLKFDQFPGAPVPFSRSYVAFKGNYTETVPAGTITRTGVYFRRVYWGTGNEEIVKVADSRRRIPGETTTFGSTAPPSAANGNILFLGLDNEDNPTMGGIYRANIRRPQRLWTVVKIGDIVPGTRRARFTEFGEVISYDGEFTAFWGAWGTETRTVRLHCPVDGNVDVIAECINQCPDTDADGNYCERQVPVQQGMFVRYPDGKIKRVASTKRVDGNFEDFLFWVFSGKPPASTGDGDDAELPRWRSSAFMSVSPNKYGVPSIVFKGLRRDGKEGLFVRWRMTRKRISPLLTLGDDATAVDPQAPAGSVVTAVGVERDGFRKCRLVANASFVNETTTDSWAGLYIKPDVCKR